MTVKTILETLSGSPYVRHRLPIHIFQSWRQVIKYVDYSSAKRTRHFDLHTAGADSDIEKFTK
jgi:hypothetical protein